MIPVHNTPFFGRPQLRKSIADSVQEGVRLLTLTGAGGFGKTRLAMACAEDVEGDFAGGSVFCDFRDPRVQTPADIENVVIAALGLDVKRGVDQATGLETHLAQRPATLLILDNLDNLVDPASGCVQRWLKASSDLQVLVTSRSRLSLPQEQCVVVGAMGLASEACQEGEMGGEAVEFFVARAKAATNSFSPSADDLAALKAIAARLDGNPLALELAAARTVVLSPRQLLERLERRFAVVKERGNNPAARSLWRTIDDSWRELKPHERLSLMAIADLPADVALETVEAVVSWLGTGIAPDLAAMDVVESLVCTSMVVARRDALSGEMRIDLYESIREFALQMLSEASEAEQEAVRRARGEVYSALLPMPTPTFDPTTPLEPLVQQSNAILDVLRDAGTGLPGALEPAAAAGVLLGAVRVFNAKGRLRDLAEPTKQLLRVSGPLSAELRVGLHITQMRLNAQANLGEQAWASMDRAAAIANNSDTPSLIGWTLSHYRLLWTHGQHPKIVEYLRESIAILGSEQLDGEVAFAKVNIGMMLAQAGDADGAFQAFEEALPLLRASASPARVSIAINNYGQLLGQAMRWREAEAAFQEALPLCRSQRLRVVLGSNIGECALVRGDLALAAQSFEGALALTQEAGFPRLEGVAQGHLGAIAHLQGDLESACRRYVAALAALGRAWPDPPAVAIVYMLLGCAETQMGLPSAAHTRGLARARLDEVADPLLDAAYEIYTGCATRTLTLDQAEAVLEASELLARENRLGRIHQTRFAMRLCRATHDLGSSAAVGASKVMTGGGARATDAPPILVAPDGGRFSMDPGEWVSLGRKGKARKVLCLLTQQRMDSPGVPAPIEDVFEAGWPGENLDEPYRSNRVYQVINQLREIGFGDLVVHDGEGYMLSLDRTVVFSND